MHLRGIQARSLLLLIVSAVLFAAVAGGITYRVGYGNRLATANDTILDLVTAVEKTAAVGVFTRDPMLLKEALAGLTHTPLVLSVEVVEHQQWRVTEQRPGQQQPRPVRDGQRFAALREAGPLPARAASSRSTASTSIFATGTSTVGPPTSPA